VKYLCIIALSGLVAIASLEGVCWSTDQQDLEPLRSKASYAKGYEIGGELNRHGVEISTDALLKGIRDGLAGEEPLLPLADIESILLELKADFRSEMRSRKDPAVEKYRGEGREFLAQNAKKDGVITLASGLQYRVIRTGTGETPGPHDRVRVHYRGTLIDGREFFSSYRTNEPAILRVDGVITGMREALQLMQEGANWRLFIPADLAYGERGPLGDRTVLFDVELISVLPPE
jgi:FKBP-type peptidyl-prolyl cis-trans isomerase FklB